MRSSHSANQASYRQVNLSAAADPQDLPLGCWLVTPRRGYTHHGIYAGDGQVVHYAGFSRAWRRGPVELISLREFCLGHGLWMKLTPGARYMGQPAVRRALSRIGEDRYRVMTNKCEHFCTWCLDGESRSPQVERWLARPRSLANATLAWFPQVLNTGPGGLTASRQ